MPSLISLTWGWTSLMRSCSILDNFSMRLPCSRSWASKAFCLVESRCIHQKQMAQQTVPARVIQNSRVFVFITNPRISSSNFRASQLGDAPTPLRRSALQPESHNGQLDAALDDAGADGVAGKSSRIMDIQLLHEMLAMLLDGFDADA